MGIFLVEKLNLLACGAHFMSKFHFGDLGFSTFWNPFKSIQSDFVLNFFKHSLQPLKCVSNINIFSMMQKSPQLEFIHMLHLLQRVSSRFHVINHTCGSKNVEFLNGLKTNINWGLRHAKNLTLTLYDYDAILNTRSVGNKGAHFYWNCRFL